jgi:RNA polymerase sigma-70 factor (ECF subfamily)
MEDLDPDVIRKAQRGDTDAFAELVRYYQPSVFSTVFRLVGGQTQSDIEDLAQDLFLKVHRALPRFDYGRGVKFSTWLFTAVKNVCYDYLRKKRLPTQPLEPAGARQKRDKGAEPARPDVPAEMHAVQPGRELLSTELGRKIGDAVQKLPQDQRTAFVLREYQALSYEEIAEITEASIGTVKSRLFRAKESLRTILSPYLTVQ